METVCYTGDSLLQFPEVVPGGREFVYSDEPATHDTVTVTVHGLRRLLRFVAQVQPLLMQTAMPQMAECYTHGECSKERVTEMLNEACSIWCEGNLVMSRLLVDESGRVLVHSCQAVDVPGVPPWERAPDHSPDATKKVSEGGQP